MRLTRILVAASLLLPLAACGSTHATMEAVSQSQLIRVPQVIGALKCAFALALEDEVVNNKRRRLSGKVAAVTLTLQIVDTTKLNGEAKAPAILALGAGGSVSPFFSGGVTYTNTVDTILKFRLRLNHEPQHPSACLATPNDVRNAYGFENWLATMIQGIEPNAAYAPAGELDSIQFKGSFGVEKKAGGGAEFDVVFVSGKAGADATRNDIQQIDFTISRPSADVPVPKTRIGDGGADTMGDDLAPR